MSGRGVDEHLLGLMVVADKAGMDLPELFTDVGYTKSVDFLLDTSQVRLVILMVYKEQNITFQILLFDFAAPFSRADYYFHVQSTNLRRLWDMLQPTWREGVIHSVLLQELSRHWQHDVWKHFSGEHERNEEHAASCKGYIVKSAWQMAE